MEYVKLDISTLVESLGKGVVMDTGYSNGWLGGIGEGKFKGCLSESSPDVYVGRLRYLHW